jgi:hypothetical protein
MSLVSFASFILPQNSSIAWFIRGKRLPHLVAFSKSVAAEVRAADARRASVVDVVNVFMAELGGGVAVLRLSDWTFSVLTIGRYNSMGEPPGNRDFSGTKVSFK